MAGASVAGVVGGIWLWWVKGPVGVERRLKHEQRDLHRQAEWLIAKRKFPEPDDFVTDLIATLKISGRCPHFDFLLKLYSTTGFL